MSVFNYDNYKPERDADESVSHLCKSLNATEGLLSHISGASKDSYCILDKETLDRTIMYLFRAQSTIWYLRHRVEELGGTNSYKGE